MIDIPSRLAAALSDRYRIERPLGEGGMATVYLADDLKHDRKVAIKVLKPELSAIVGAERFLAEIRTTANLQHPHILPLFDSGEADHFLFYVMPYVKGESLRERLDREGQFPVEDAVRLARGVASALDYAHRQGIVHRDVKPANILLHDGEPLVADFGIALAVQQAGGGRLTETGLSLGTPYYMSPEQATGDRDPDARSDLYSLGSVLYEMLAGEPPHTGSTAQSVIGKILTRDAAPIRETRRAVPEHVAMALERALERLPADRFSSVADFALALEGKVVAGGAGSHRAARGAGSTTARWLWPAAAGAAALLAAWGWLRPSPGMPASPASHLAVPLPRLGGGATALSRQVTITPDGSTILYTAIAPDGENRTMRRRLHETESAVLPGVTPFLSDYLVSPDGTEFIGRDTNWRLFRYAIDGSNERALPGSIPPNWAAWAPDGSVWFTTDVTDEGIIRLDPSGEVSRPFEGRFFDATMQQVLPDGRTALTVRSPRGISSGHVSLLDLVDGTLDTLLTRNVVGIRYTAGFLVYVVEGGSMQAVAFDAEQKRITGEPVTLADGVMSEGGVAQFEVSANGTVVYIPEEPRFLQFVDRDGRIRPATAENRNFHSPTFSPDGRRVAVDFTSAEGRNVWVLSVDDGVPTRATFDTGGHDARWTPDGRFLTYLAEPAAGGQFGIHRTRPGNLESDSLFTAVGLTFTGEWLSDGSAIVTTADGTREGSGSDVVIVRNEGRGPLDPLVATRFEEGWPSVSPDDRWLAYGSDRSGIFEVYVRPLDREGDEIQVSLDGGTEPVWGSESTELFYRNGAGPGSEMIAATLRTQPELEVVSREPLFSTADVATATPHGNYDVSPDGETFALVRFNPSTRVMVIQNLPDLVRRLGGGSTN